MKTVRIISVVLLVLMTGFFIVLANLNASKVAELKDENRILAKDAERQAELAKMVAEDAKAAEAIARAAQAEAERLAQELEKCKKP